MGADDHNVEAGTIGAGSGRPPACRRAFPAGAAADTAAVPGTMRAVVLDAPGPPSTLAICKVPVPVPVPVPSASLTAGTRTTPASPPPR
jgi:hypothetical protein